MYTANLSRWLSADGHFQDYIKKDTDPLKDFFISVQHRDDWHVPTPILRNTLQLEFADFYDLDDEIGSPYKCITDEQARQIASYMRTVRGKGGNLWVNCHAGISRSGAIVEIALKLGWWKDLESPLQETRYPNSMVFRKIAKYFPELHGRKGIPTFTEESMVNSHNFG